MVIGLLLSHEVFAKTSVGIVLIFHVLTGLSLSSFSIFGAAFFQKSQLSGIIVIIISLLLAVIAQFVDTNAGAGKSLFLILKPRAQLNFESCHPELSVSTHELYILHHPHG